MSKAVETRSLWALQPGEECAVTGFDDALPEPYRIRLMEFGFHPGETVSCLISPGLGAPRVYRVSNSVFSLDVEVASRVLVKDTVADDSVDSERPL